MDLTIGFKTCLVLFICYTYADARSLEIMDMQIMPADNKIPIEVSELTAGNQQLCTVCENLTAEALNYLSENETQIKIINTLHKACSLLHPFKKQCIVLVDYYAHLFFMEITTFHPDQLCEKFDLCELTLVRDLKRDDACKLCHHVVIEVLLKLRDPDAQLEIVELLLKGCSKVEAFVQECKKLVLQYAPSVIANMEKFLETTDVCVDIHACKANEETSSMQVTLSAS